MKLQSKLIIGFVGIVLLMGISQSLFLQSMIRSTFEEYLSEYNFGFMERMKQTLEAHYEETGSWDYVQELYFDDSSSPGHGNGMMMRGMMMHMTMSNADLLFVNTDGKIIADTAGTRIGESGEDFSGKELELYVDGIKLGTLVLYQHELKNLEEQFLRSVKFAIVIGSLIVAAVAALLSIWIARKITLPLRQLVKGINRIASGEKVDEVKIGSKDEFNELGEAFNDMSRKLARNEEVRQALVADVAHELRTPLAILQGKLESIQEGAVEPSEKIVLELTDEVYRLNRLVSDLQQLSLAEARKLPLNLQPVHIKALIDKICSNLQWMADEKEITLRYENVPADFWYELDADRMTQVLVNLVGNALRHTPPKGTVEVSAQVTDGKLSISVADNGPGIPEDVLPFIFNRFYKRDPSRSRTEGGTGLGLSIAKGFVEAHGGRIDVQSKLNKGSVFTISL